MNKDASIVRHILIHISNIADAKTTFGNDIGHLKSNTHYFNFVCMSLLQIGELANHLSDDFISFKFNKEQIAEPCARSRRRRSGTARWTSVPSARRWGTTKDFRPRASTPHSLFPAGLDKTAEIADTES
jgi:hypothetical protein